MSAFTEPLAQVREALRDYRDAGDRPGMFVAGQDALAALAQVERLATDMEKALEEIKSYYPGEEWDEDDQQRIHRIARRVLSAREEGTHYDHEMHQWVGQCPHGDVCTGCDARGYCTREEGADA